MAENAKQTFGCFDYEAFDSRKVGAPKNSCLLPVAGGLAVARLGLTSGGAKKFGWGGGRRPGCGTGKYSRDSFVFEKSSNCGTTVTAYILEYILSLFSKSEIPNKW